jgi:hypothetical protein
MHQLIRSLRKTDSVDDSECAQRQTSPRVGGPYSKINSAVNTSTAYTDNTVTAGQTYYYVTTAVDGSGNESGYSNQVQAVIPTS